MKTFEEDFALGKVKKRHRFEHFTRKFKTPLIHKPTFTSSQAKFGKNKFKIPIWLNRIPIAMAILLIVVGLGYFSFEEKINKYIVNASNINSNNLEFSSNGTDTSHVLSASTNLESTLKGQDIRAFVLDQYFKVNTRYLQLAFHFHSELKQPSSTFHLLRFLRYVTQI